MRVSLIFAIIISFMLFTVFPLVYVLYFEEFLIHDSRGFMILKNNSPNLLGLYYFPLNTLPAGMYGTDLRTDGRTDSRINLGGAG